MADEKKTTTKKPAKKKKPDYPERWANVIGAFAKSLGSDLEAMTPVLASLAGEPSDEALETLANSGYVSDELIREALGNAGLKVGESVPIGVFNKNLAALRTACAPAAPTAPTAPAPTADLFGGGVGSYDILPNVPEDSVSLLSKLTIGGELKVDEVSVLCAARALLAQRTGVRDVPGKLIDLMDAHADDVTAEPFTTAMYDVYETVEKIKNRRSHGDILKAVGVPGSFANAKRKRQFLERVEKHLVPGLFEFRSTVKSWQDSYLAAGANPMQMMQVIAAVVQRLPVPGGMAPPDTAMIRDAALSFNDAANKTFAGSGIPCARALAHDVIEIHGLLDLDLLPLACGFTTRDQLLKSLKINASRTDERNEHALARYIISVIRMKDVAPGHSELAYVNALTMLDTQIKWDSLGLAGRGTPGFIDRASGSGPLSDKGNGGSSSRYPR